MKKSPTRFIRRVDNKFTSASLDLNFQNMTTSGFDSRITFTRASSGTYFDGSGILQTASTNVPRLDHSPTTRLPLGLLIEEQRTNSIRNNTMVGAVAGTPGTLPTNWSIGGVGTLTQEIVGIGTVNGIAYIDVKLSGTTSTSQFVLRFDGANNIAVSNGQTWAISSWVSVVGGSLTNINAVALANNLFNSGVTYIGEGPGSVFAVSNTFQRYSVAATINNATAAFIRPYLYMTFSSGVAIDITLRIGLPQLEQGAFATSVIPTTTAAATRNADVASMTGTNFSSWYNATEGTVFVNYASAAANASGIARRMAALGDGTSSNRILVTFGNTNAISDFSVVSSGSSQFNVTSFVMSSSGGKIVGVYKSSDFAAVYDGGSPETQTSGTVPSGLTTLYIGGTEDGTNSSTRNINGHIRRIAYWGVRLDNSKLQALTT